ncbi:Pyridoxal phosphate homeostasis protein [Rubripirellula obstinata]|uniref:Pyridoxal phosphate homeostasis protein n=1 Tax=Rubripirellula obstinata TaxID=406547 RepID=A0A5B1CFT0_9BACT|nr:YggS family pyridoxal phosphate-dependent enzyme [Rubripirellula obstinata]KAA1258353.1 Pyridoxal phosphate homeostasis protein [Rubripirellula obstinata]
MSGLGQQHRDRIAANWAAVVNDVANAATAAGRSPGDVKIIGVTKYVDAETTAALVDAGCYDLGENRPQVLWEKAESEWIDDSVRWHIIGHLQRNKVRRTLRHSPIIHSIDSSRLLDAIATESVAQNKTTDAMLEVNISGDDAKTGMNVDELKSLLEKFGPSAGGVRVIGLMAMAGWGTEVDQARDQFAKVRALSDQLKDQTEHPLTELSMGMSGDFQAAIAEGSTMVRIGSRLFEGVMDAH